MPAIEQFPSDSKLGVMLMELRTELRKEQKGGKKLHAAEQRPRSICGARNPHRVP